MSGLTCKDCGTYHDSYNDLKHIDWDTGGFCQGCGSDDFIEEGNDDEPI
jgi:hypothetical protein